MLAIADIENCPTDCCQHGRPARLRAFFLLIGGAQIIQPETTPSQFLFEIGCFLRFHEPKQIALQQADIE